VYQGLNMKIDNSLSTKKVAKNMVLSISAQLVSVIATFILNFIVPKYITEISYAYWQIYVLYVGYVGILHFGLLDGIVLRYSQYDYDQLNKAKMQSQFKWLLFSTTLISICTIFITLLFFRNGFQNIIILVSVGIITKNIFTYNSYLFQITNRINLYAILIVLQRVTYAIIVIILLFFKIDNFLWYCLADLIGDVVGIISSSFFNRGMYFGKHYSLKETKIEISANISSGFLLTIANFSSFLLIGAAKMIIQWKWGELVFGKIALSFSATNIFLVFINAVSVVLFPSIKRVGKAKLPKIYDNIRKVISPLLFFCLIFYYPLSIILNIWLPKYESSLVYLGILLPLIVYSSKVNLLTNNYLKAYRKEKIMFVINVISVLFGIFLFCLGAYVFNDLYFVLYSVVFSTFVKSVISEIVVSKYINRKYYSSYVIEFVMTVLFIVSARYCDFLKGFILYLISLIIYMAINIKAICSIFRKIRYKINFYIHKH